MIFQSKKTTCIVQLKQNTAYLLKKETYYETKRDPATLSCDTTTHKRHNKWTDAETAVDEMVRWCTQWKMFAKKLG